MENPTTQRHLLSDETWEVGWDGHELAQLKRMAALTFIEKVEWLEQAQRMVSHMQKAGALQTDSPLQKS